MTLDPFGLLGAALAAAVVLSGPARRWLAERRRRPVRAAEMLRWSERFERENPEGTPFTAAEIAEHVAWFESLARAALILRPAPADDPCEAGARIGGPAWLAAEETWPLDVAGAPLEFVAQVDFSRLPPLAGFPERGLARFFVGRDEFYGANFDGPDRSAARVLWHDASTEGGRLEPQPPLGAQDCSPFHNDALRERGLALAAAPICDLPDAYSWEPVARLEGALRRNGSEEITEQFEELAEAREFGHRIGGHPVFTQSDFREPGAFAEFDTVLLGLSSDDAIMWGDVGEAVFLIRAADLAARDFSKIAFHWDCG